MALTPEDVVNQKFTITKFRDGYDLDQVDDFLDTIVEELRQHEQEKAELQKQIDDLSSQLEAAHTQANEAVAAAAEAPVAEESSDQAAGERVIVVDAPPAPPAPVAPAAAETTTVASKSNENDAKKSSAMLQLALELHDKHVREGEETRNRLITEGEETSRKLIEEAQGRRAEELRLLDNDRKGVQTAIKDLREFEGEYRTTLRSYIQSQLRGLDGSPEPSGAPEGLE